MAADPEIYTLTMARIYRAQGHDDRAAAIYRRLLARDPHNAELRAALAELDGRSVPAASSAPRALEAAGREWARLVRRYRRRKNSGKG